MCFIILTPTRLGWIGVEQLLKVWTCFLYEGVTYQILESCLNIADKVSYSVGFDKAMIIFDYSNYIQLWFRL